MLWLDANTDQSIRVSHQTKTVSFVVSSIWESFFLVKKKLLPTWF